MKKCCLSIVCEYELWKGNWLKELKMMKLSVCLKNYVQLKSWRENDKCDNYESLFQLLIIQK